MNDRVVVLLSGRREKMTRALGRPMAPVEPPESALSPSALSHLLGEAEDLYWNELEWERVTEEEMVDDEPLVQLIFPGFLAFVRGLLLSEAMPDSLASADPRPEVVEGLLGFLAGRTLVLQEELGGLDIDAAASDQERLDAELVLTDRLIDQVLYLLHGLSTEEIDRLETARAQGRRSEDPASGAQPAE